MIFNDQVVTEITAPSNVPFLPGFDVIGFGTEIPPELVAYGLDAAIIFYTSSWDTSVTTPRIKFMFIATHAGELLTGYGYSLNPSTTPTATVVIENSHDPTLGGGQVLTDWYLTSSRYPTALTDPRKTLFRILEGVPPTQAGGGILQLFDANANRILQIQPDNNATSYGCAISILDGNTGNVILQWNNLTDTLLFGTSQFGYQNWVQCTYANGWGAAAPNFNRRAGVWVRRFPDGIVQCTGVAQGGTNTVGTYIVQLPAQRYWPSSGKIFLVHSQNASNLASIVVDSGNGAMTIVGANATSGETNFETSWSTL